MGPEAQRWVLRYESCDVRAVAWVLRSQGRGVRCEVETWGRSARRRTGPSCPRGGAPLRSLMLTETALWYLMPCEVALRYPWNPYGGARVPSRWG